MSEHYKYMNAHFIDLDSLVDAMMIHKPNVYHHSEWRYILEQAVLKIERRYTVDASQIIKLFNEYAMPVKIDDFEVLQFTNLTKGNFERQVEKLFTKQITGQNPGNY